MPLSTINSNSFSTTANTNIDNGNLFIDAINNRIGVGTTGPTEALDVRANATFGSAAGTDASIHIQSGYDVGIKYVSRLTTDYNGNFNVSTGSTATANTPSSAALTHRMRVDVSGNFNLGSTVGTNGVQLSQNTAVRTTAGYTTGVLGWSSSFGSGLSIRSDVISSANYGILESDSGTSGWKIRTYSGGYAYRFEFAANGSAYNTNGTWGTISDARIKQDVVSANSAWSDIKSLAFKKYRLKSDVAFESSEENIKGFVAPTMFGLVAQEVQQISPGLVEETDSSEVEDGKLLAIKTSVLLMKATKALQEAMERIETLEAKVSTLEAQQS